MADSLGMRNSTRQAHAKVLGSPGTEMGGTQREGLIRGTAGRLAESLVTALARGETIRYVHHKSRGYGDESYSVPYFQMIALKGLEWLAKSDDAKTAFLDRLNGRTDVEKDRVHDNLLIILQNAQPRVTELLFRTRGKQKVAPGETLSGTTPRSKPIALGIKSCDSERFFLVGRIRDEKGKEYQVVQETRDRLDVYATENRYLTTGELDAIKLVFDVVKLMSPKSIQATGPNIVKVPGRDWRYDMGDMLGTAMALKKNDPRYSFVPEEMRPALCAHQERHSEILGVEMAIGF